jgi:predicted house-cleaning noncanonical NTP pyrophosphatase (MazG superfamily)
MTDKLLYSDSSPVISWSEVEVAKRIYGPKGSGLIALPRAWTPGFILVPASLTSELPETPEALGSDFSAKAMAMAGPAKSLIVRSSVIGETIWDRGKYKSVIVSLQKDGWQTDFREAVRKVLASASGRHTALVIQKFIEPKQRGEFGNLLRVSKTRDQWELTTFAAEGAVTTTRHNTQRDISANPNDELSAKPRLPRERLFGSIAAWLNNVLLRGHGKRLNCEWVSDSVKFYLVQIDEEDEDFIGINPFQLTVEPIHLSHLRSGAFLKLPDDAAIEEWDKLKVLRELWGDDHSQRPPLLYVPVSSVPISQMAAGYVDFESDFYTLLGPDNIVVRTSMRSSDSKVLNLNRTDCLTPARAAEWCIIERQKLIDAGNDPNHFAFIIHRYIAARSSAWASASPADPIVEIHGIWGLPDALQYCSYDIWEVHVPTGSATEYPDYKSHMLILQDGGAWSYVRIKNDIARGLSISRKDALDIANRTHEIAQRLGCGCHVMWFVGCIDESGKTFNIPWYWVPAKPSGTNEDRERHQSITISNREGLARISEMEIERDRYMLVLKPTEPSLFRDNKFVSEVAALALAKGMPVLIEGSRLAHAYYQLVDSGCVVIARGEKEYSRVRHSVPFGKIVRDKIPGRIAARQELGATAVIPPQLREAFLIGKIMEEALEVRESTSKEERRTELADVWEIVRSLAEMSGIPLSEVEEAANKKREKLGGFELGHLLMQTGIGGPGQTTLVPNPSTAQVLSRRISGDICEIPFTFFGFAELETPRILAFPDFGFLVELTLKNDRIALRLIRQPEQLELPLSLEIEAGTWSSKPKQNEEN